MQTRPIAITLRSKKLGVLLKAARLSAGKSIEDCAEVINSPNEVIEAFEIGDASPSLPELEALAFYLKIPLEHFWGREVTLAEKADTYKFDSDRLLAIRQRMIGAQLRQARFDAGQSLEGLAEKSGLEIDQLTMYEIGEQPIPLPELESLANVLNRPLKDFQDNRGPIGTWLKQQRVLQNFAELTPDLQDFLSKPINRPYLELAQRLSEMNVEKLRAVAEGLLEITL
jgi:transcriptional regulator with XRE-family HTH domain